MTLGGLARGALRFGPGFGGDVFDLPVSHLREAGEHFAQVSVRVDASTPAAFDDSVKDRAALAGFGLADEEPVFLAHGGGADGVFNEVVVDLDTTVFEVDAERVPLAEGILDGLPEQALRKVLPAGFEAHQGTLYSSDDGAALRGAGSGCADAARPAFHAVLFRGGRDARFAG